MDSLPVATGIVLLIEAWLYSRLCQWLCSRDPERCETDVAFLGWAGEPGLGLEGPDVEGMPGLRAKGRGGFHLVSATVLSTTALEAYKSAER